MCSQVQCRKCGKITWSGCGQHVSEVMRGVPKSQICAGHENDPKEPNLLSRLLGRR